MRAACLTHLRHVALITELIIGEDCNHDALQHVFVITVCTSPHSGPSIALGTLWCSTHRRLPVCLNTYTHCLQFV